MKENIKLKIWLKNLYEDNEYESSFNDEVYEWNGDFEEPHTVKYNFRYHFKVTKVFGEEDNAVASIDVIITDFTIDGEDVMLGWKEIGYNEDVWYIEKLSDDIYGEMMSEIPFSIYLTFYGKDEYKKQHNE